MTSGTPIDPFRRNDKRVSWNEFGSTYWARAGSSSHPSELETATFLGDTGPGDRVLVVGATTAELIGAALERGAEVHVADFAENLLALTAQRFGDRLTTHHHDITNPPPADLASRFDLVVADRLVNRFHRSEMPQVAANLMSFVAPGGDLRISVRFGLYPLDRKLIQRGEELGTLTRFWDHDTLTIDWAHVTTEIDDVAENNGEIPASVVAAWSRMRGVESRIPPEDIATIAHQASTLGPQITFAPGIAMDLAPDSMIFIATRA